MPNMYIRKKVIKGHEYYYLVEGKLINGKVKQRVITYIGNKEKLNRFYKKFPKAE